MLQAIVSGLLLGGLYAIVGVGMSLIFGIMKLTNLAHGDIMIMSSFITIYIIRHLVENPILALIVTIAIMIPFCILLQKFLINKVIDKGDEAPLLIMFGLSIAIQNALLLIFGAGMYSVPSGYIPFNTMRLGGVGGVIIPGTHLFNFVSAVVIISALALVMTKTPLGRAIRASSSNTKAAELMGVNTKRMYIYAMCLTVVVTSIAGLLVSTSYPFAFYTGTQYLILAFGVVVIGGMGSLMGTLIGGLILGLGQLIGTQIFGFGFQLHSGYILLLIVLTIRPQGLLSKAIRKQ